MRAAGRVGMLFLPDDDKLAALSKTIVEDVVKAEGRCHIVGWRDVPVVKEVVGPLAAAVQPRIVQASIPAVITSQYTRPVSLCFTLCQVTQELVQDIDLLLHTFCVFVRHGTKA